MLNRWHILKILATRSLKFRCRLGSLSFTWRSCKTPVKKPGCKLSIYTKKNPYPNYRLFVSCLHDIEEIWLCLLKGESQWFLHTENSLHMSWEELVRLWKQLYNVSFSRGSFVMTRENIIMSCDVNKVISVWDWRQHFLMDGLCY